MVSSISLLQSDLKILMGLLRAVSYILILIPGRETSKEKFGIFSKTSHHESGSERASLPSSLEVNSTELSSSNKLVRILF